MMDPLMLVVRFVAFLASLAFHEFSHAAAAKLLGDDTAERSGRLTLNPLAHADPVGTFLLPLAGLMSGGFVFGWAKPVPYNAYNLRDQKWGPSIVAVAGPLSNALLIVISALALKAINPPGDNALGLFLVSMIMINAALFMFNLIPIPPLDGSKFLLSALDHPRHARTRFMLETRGPIILMAIVLGDAFLLNGLIFGTLFGYLIRGISLLFGL